MPESLAINGKQSESINRFQQLSTHDQLALIKMAESILSAILLQRLTAATIPNKRQQRIQGN